MCVFSVPTASTPPARTCVVTASSPSKSALIQRASRVVLLVDGAKLTHTAPVKLVDLEALSSIVTNGPVPAELRERCDALDVDLVLVSKIKH